MNLKKSNFYRLSFVFFTISVLSLTSYVPCAHAYENGKPVNWNGFPAVMVINKTPEGKPSFRCSGVMIAPHFILYAGHCIERKAPFPATMLISGEPQQKNIHIKKVFFPPREMVQRPQQENAVENSQFASQYPETTADKQIIILENAMHTAIQENPFTDQGLDIALVEVKEKLPYHPIRLAEHRIKPNDPILVGGYGMKRAISDEAALSSQDEALVMFEKIKKTLKTLNHSPKQNADCFRENTEALEILKRYDRAFDFSKKGHGTLTADRRDIGLVFNQHFSLALKKGQKPTLPLDEVEKEIDTTSGIKKETYQALHSVLNMPYLTDGQDEAINRLNLRKRPAAQTNTHRGDSGAPAFKLNPDFTLPQTPELAGINFGGIPSDYPYGIEFYVRVDLESPVGRWIQSKLSPAGQH